MNARVLIWVQHLLGFGHFARACVVAEALRDAGFRVTLVSGGVTPVEAVPQGMTFVQLPAARAKDESFDELVDAEGRDVDRAWHEARRALLLDSFREAQADVVITETFPFGRRLLEIELLALLDEAKRAPSRPKIVASVRDVLQRPRRDARAATMVARAREMYDAVLVHCDPSVLRLEQSFAETSEIAGRCLYTGYICAEAQTPAGPRREILVSAGGGAAGGRLIATAIKARVLSRMGKAPWTFVTGPLANPSLPADGVTIVRSLRDFRSRLAGAAVSISQAGYNTLVETVRARTPAIVAPYETVREQEQAARAAAFAARGLVRVIRTHALEPIELARLVDVTAGSTPPAHEIDFNGRAGTVSALRRLL